MKIHLFLLAAMAFLCACAENELVEGGLYSSKNDDGTYAIIKILKIDDEGFHVRIYSNSYDKHQKNIDEGSLYIASVDDENEELGMGHLPVSRNTFYSWTIKYIKKVEVVAEELEGYKMWEEASGGYF